MHWISEPIRRILAPLNIFRKCFRPHRSLRNILTHVKDPIALEHRTGVVYSIPCHDCPVTYVGQTGRMLFHRLKEHKQAFRSANSSTSAVAEHAISSSHTIAWDKTSVIDSNPHLHPRCALEAWHIWSQQHPPNWERGTSPLRMTGSLHAPPLTPEVRARAISHQNFELNPCAFSVSSLCI